MKDGQEIVAIVDDDESIRKALCMLIETLGVTVRLYASALELLDDPQHGECDCVLLDVRMRGMTGLELQSELAARGWSAPIIFMTGHGDVPMAVQAMQGGAVDFLQKPLDDRLLLDRIRSALEANRLRLARDRSRAESRRRLQLLSRRENEVLQRLIKGEMNKVVAAELNISIKTVEDHRASIMSKMGAKSFAELLRMVHDARGLANNNHG
jgi:FixJ family two-component response regulator